MLTLQFNLKLRKRTHYNEERTLATQLEVSLMDLAHQKERFHFIFCLSSTNVIDYNAKGELIVGQWK